MDPARTALSVETVRRLEAASSAFGSAIAARMEGSLPWYRALPPSERSWVSLVAQAGFASFMRWLQDPSVAVVPGADVFGTAPRELTRAVTLEQTVELVRTAIDACEEGVDAVVTGEDLPRVREALLRYSREVAFGAAGVYARAAETRGAWDARLEALVVDAVLRGDPEETIGSRASALGWHLDAAATVVAGSAGDVDGVVPRVRRVVRGAGGDCLVGVQGERLVVVLGAVADPLEVAAALAESAFGPGPVVVGPQVPALPLAGRSARAALAGVVAARAWPGAPRPVLADDLLPERALSGDVAARRALVDRVHRPLAAAQGALLETLTSYLEHGASLEGCARALFVHPNTVRYRLRRVSEVCGWNPVVPRERFVLQLALLLGRLAAPSSPRSNTP
ncbi:PucR-like helix-turn-helix protein [Kineococcus xinjiangensis]|uniref:PucR-like helix-turn-helix protein n=1 Tax=Kineococcus xinjiangensis TaxID=512762 RepID=A0A2S6IML6_9ACTN|nr:helix-turn-helix domain-containing protein [Kineococcus xinjiangensis]PPK95396.1 PucR-like helix-turn-helix protein [Kineococcus xinjiangensis]